MLTPAMQASSTSAPPEVIRRKARWTHVSSPPFLKTLPFEEATTAGLARCKTTAGAPALRVLAEAAASPAAAPVRRKSRLLILLLIGSSGSVPVVGKCCSLLAQLQRLEHPLVGVHGDLPRPAFETEVEGLVAPADLDRLASRPAAVPAELPVERHAA